MGLKLGQNINFLPFLGFCSVFGHDTSFLVATQFPDRDQVFWSRPSFLVATQFPGGNSISGQQLVFLLQLVGAITSSF